MKPQAIPAVDPSVHCCRYAVLSGSVPCLEALIEGGADVEAKNLFKYTALHCAAMWGQVKNILCII